MEVKLTACSFPEHLQLELLVAKGGLMCMAYLTSTLDHRSSTNRLATAQNHCLPCSYLFVGKLQLRFT